MQLLTQSILPPLVTSFGNLHDYGLRALSSIQTKLVTLVQWNFNKLFDLPINFDTSINLKLVGLLKGVALEVR